MRIQMNHGNRSINRLQRPQNREHNRVISPQTDDPGMFPPILSVVCRRMVQDLSVSLFHLLEGVRSVEGCYRDISAVDLLRESVGIVLRICISASLLQFAIPPRTDLPPRRYYSFVLSSPVQIPRGCLVARNVRQAGMRSRCHMGSLGRRYLAASTRENVRYHAYMSVCGVVAYTLS